MRDRSTTSHNLRPTTIGSADVEGKRLATHAAITRSDCRAPFGAVKPLRSAPTLRASGLDSSSRAPRDGTYVMAGKQ